MINANCHILRTFKIRKSSYKTCKTINHCLIVVHKIANTRRRRGENPAHKSFHFEFIRALHDSSSQYFTWVIPSVSFLKFSVTQGKVNLQIENFYGRSSGKLFSKYRRRWCVPNDWLSDRFCFFFVSFSDNWSLNRWSLKIIYFVICSEYRITACSGLWSDNRVWPTVRRLNSPQVDQ